MDRGAQDRDRDLIWAGPASPLGINLGRYPGPVWTLVLWCLLSALNIAYALLLPSAEMSEVRTAVRVGILAYTVVSIVALLILAERTPTWLLRALVWSGVVIMAAYVATAPSALSAAMISWGYVAVAGYAGYWGSRRFTVAVVAAASVTFFLALLAGGFLGQLGSLWLVVSSTVVVLGLLLNALLRRLQRLAVRDPLTGLLNRRGLEVFLDARGVSGRVTSPCALVVIDLDGLKTVNDQHGHRAGDAVLQGFGRLLRESLRADDVAARSGGDEFTLVLLKTNVNEAHQLLARIRAAATTPFSYGAADFTGRRDFDLAIAEADAGMYADKDSRRREP